MSIVVDTVTLFMYCIYMKNKTDGDTTRITNGTDLVGIVVRVSPGRWWARISRFNTVGHTEVVRFAGIHNTKREAVAEVRYLLETTS